GRRGGRGGGGARRRLGDGLNDDVTVEKFEVDVEVAVGVGDLGVHELDREVNDRGLAGFDGDRGGLGADVIAGSVLGDALHRVVAGGQLGELDALVGGKGGLAEGLDARAAEDGRGDLELE